MKRLEFDEKMEQLTRFQRPVLKQFLAGKTDEEIAKSLEPPVHRTSVCKHISNICKIFDLSNGEGEHYSYKDDLIVLFAKYQPDWVAPALRDRYSPRKPEAEFPGRPVALGSQFYLQQTAIEEECYRTIMQPSTLIRIRAARKMGKTSLLNRILADAQQKGCRTVYLNLGQVEKSIFDDLDRFFQWFCAEVSDSLNVEFQSEDWERNRIGSMRKCKAYFKQNFLERADTPLVLAIDEVDRLFEFPKIAADFFALLRGWYEEQNNIQTWGKLRQIVVYATDNYTDLDINRSPFNVGLPIHLPRLTLPQIQQLAQRYGLRWRLDEAPLIMAMVGGHPHLIQLALYYLQNGEKTLDEILELAPTQTGIYQNHLQHLWEKLQGSTSLESASKPLLLDAFKQVMESEGHVRLTPEVSYKLQGLGLVEQEKDRVKLTCELYRRYFSQRLALGS